MSTILQSPKTAAASATSSGPIREFATKVSRYFLEFLDTDFRRAKLPKRRIQLKNDLGLRTAINLRKYPDFYAAVWALAAKPGAGRQLRIKKKQFTAKISPTLLSLIEEHTSALPESTFAQVRLQALEYARSQRPLGIQDPEQYVERVQSSFVESVGREIVAPVLQLLERAFERTSLSAVDSVYEVETDLVSMITRPAVEQMAKPLVALVARGDEAPFKDVLDTFFTETDIERLLLDFFRDFAAADLQDELMEVMSYVKTGAEGLSFYLYLCDIKHRATNFPLFYVPLNISLDPETNALELTLDPLLYIHKQAIDFVVQELEGAANKLAIGAVEKRIVHIDEARSIVDEIVPVIGKLQLSLGLSGLVDVRQSQLQQADSASIKVTNGAYLAAFDRSDESVLNDYESLLSVLTAEDARASQLFQDIIGGMLMQEPVSVKREVEAKWAEVPVAERLVASSPIPLNEEQRKILKTLRHDQGRFLVVQGPPGTGKSHTITAIAFDCIMSGRNVLVLSDKQEALDVVEDKLRDSLASVRTDDDFPDPILRLGRQGGTYTRLLSAGSQEKIRNYHRSQSAAADKLDMERGMKEDRLKRLINETISAYSAINMRDLGELHRLEASLGRVNPQLVVRLRHPAAAGSLDLLAGSVTKVGSPAEAVAFVPGDRPKTVAHLYQAALIEGLTAELQKDVRLQHLSLAGWIGVDARLSIRKLLAEAAALRWPVFGFLFVGGKIAAINVQLIDLLGPGAQSLDVRKDAPRIQGLLDAMLAVDQGLQAWKLPADFGVGVWGRLRQGQPGAPSASALVTMLRAFEQCYGAEILELVGARKAPTFADLVAMLSDAARYATLWQRIEAQFRKVPSYDFAGLKGELEQLHVTSMTREIDGRFIGFIDSHRGLAKSLAGVIKAKQQFPQEQFEPLKNAFPCVIAGIREFAEYIPLKEALFDVVVIDEASQVSVAQAFPALLRAKKAVVLGDRHQFSNVKSATASKELNRGWLNELEGFFRERISAQSDKIQRLKHFDVKRSILDFFDLIANNEVVLKKHFRGYMETISFSSKYFYDKVLQAIKIRSRPIEEVIKFTELPPAAAKADAGNTNRREVDFIVEELERLLASEQSETVGIITPFREQQALLSRIILHHAKAQHFAEKLRLKIMTFDTCQGEERDIIIYSMVATSERDLLNYIFPVSLENISDDVEEKLKVQRLNVGLSRAKETMHFVLSKPIDEFKGTAGRVLAHYRQVLQDDARLPKAGDTDARSPMEAKVLDYLKQTAFFRKHQEHIQVQAQFPIGEYLRQLDPLYKHPAYRCDFLIRVASFSRPINIIVEYDGFEFHFNNQSEVDGQNYPDYYKPEDVERQLILEGYGYKFLRINRFNLGRDPVSVLSQRLEDLVHAAREDRTNAVVEAVRTAAEDLQSRESKVCTACGNVRALDEFWDPALSDGQGAYGRKCMPCKRKRT